MSERVSETGEASATSELAALIEADGRGDTGPVAPEGTVELAAEDSNAPIDYSIVIPLVLVVAAVVAWGLLGTANFSEFADASFTWVIENLGWAFVLFGTVFVGFVIVIALSKFGSIRLLSLIHI